MVERIVINTGPLVTLALIEALEVPGRLPYALERQIPLVCIDEWKGRRIALAVGLRVMGTLGLLGRAKTLGIVDAVKPLVERALRNGVRYHPELVRKVLESVGE